MTFLSFLWNGPRVLLLKVAGFLLLGLAIFVALLKVRNDGKIAERNRNTANAVRSIKRRTDNEVELRGDDEKINKYLKPPKNR